MGLSRSNTTTTTNGGGCGRGRIAVVILFTVGVLVALDSSSSNNSLTISRMDNMFNIPNNQYGADADDDDVDDEDRAGGLNEMPISSPSYKLAFEQSGGFFDDIPDESWRRMQQIARRTWPNHYTEDLQRYANHPQKLKSNWWNAENFQEEMHCQFAERLPSDSNGDGPKWVCDPHRIAQQKECLVYSIGSNGNVQFEKAVKDQISQGCEIHTFDLIGSNKRHGNFAKALAGVATFHRWGLGTEEQAQKNPSQFKTLSQTVKELGHEGRRIDIFKIDCELCEWHVYKEWLQPQSSSSSAVAVPFELKQILVETHNAPMPYARDFFFELHDAGYAIFSKEGNFQNACGGVEFAFLKLSPEFFIDGSLYKNRQYNNISTT